MTIGPTSPAMESARREILAAALRHVPFDGWSQRTVDAAARDAGRSPSEARRAFPRGPRDLIDFFLAETDRRMLVELDRRDLQSMRVRDRIAVAVRAHLEQNAQHREAVRRAIGVQLLPQNAVGAMTGLYRTVDAIWHAAGDTATDFSFYTKRALLAAVYTSTLLYWLDDRSEGSADTWRFLDRRIDDVMRIQKLRGGFGLRRTLDRLRRPLPDRRLARRRN